MQQNKILKNGSGGHGFRNYILQMHNQLSMVQETCGDWWGDQAYSCVTFLNISYGPISFITFR